jgi:hypothetical protein
MVAPRTRTYILQRTRGFFTGRPDDPCSGAARLVPTNSGAAPLRPTALMTALRSPDYSGGSSSDLRHGRGWSLASVSDEGNVNVRGSAALDKQ